MSRTIDIGLPVPPWQATVKGNPVVISTTPDNAGMVQASADGKYFGADGIPHKARKGDLIPADARFEAAEAAPAEDATTDATATPATPAKTGKTGPSETTAKAGPAETASATTTVAPVAGS